MRAAHSLLSTWREEQNVKQSHNQMTHKRRQDRKAGHCTMLYDPMAHSYMESRTKYQADTKPSEAQMNWGPESLNSAPCSAMPMAHAGRTLVCKCGLQTQAATTGNQAQTTLSHKLTMVQQADYAQHYQACWAIVK